MIVTAHAHDDLGRQDFQNVFAGKGLLTPGGYLEKPVQPETYVRLVCQSVGVEYPTLDSEGRGERVRDEVEGLLDSADPGQLAEILRILKRRDRS